MKAHVSREQQRHRALLAFMDDRRFPSALRQKFNARDLELLIDLMAAAGKDNGLTEDVYWIISNLIEELSSVSSPEATKSLEALSSKANLALWHPTIVDSIYRQTSKRREAEFPALQCPRGGRSAGKS